jgi:hypothetical protein
MLCKTVILAVFGLVSKLKSTHPPAGGCSGFIFVPALNTTKTPSLSKPPKYPFLEELYDCINVQQESLLRNQINKKSCIYESEQ